MEPEPSPRETAVADALESAGVRDPLDVVTEFDLRALDRVCGVFRGSASEGIVRVNEHFLTVTGLSPAAARGWDWLTLVHAEDRERLRRAVEAACQTGAHSAFPIRMQVHLGRIETLRVAIMALPAGALEPMFVGALETEAEVPEPKAEVQVPVAVDATDPFEVLVGALPIAVAYAAPDGIIEYANDAWTAHIGVATTLAEALEVADESDESELAVALGRNASWSGSAIVARQRVDLTIGPLAERLGGGHVVTLTPSTHAVDADKAPASSPLELCCALLDASPDFATVLDPRGHVTYANAAASALLGISASDLPTDGPLSDYVTFADAEGDLQDRLTERLAREDAVTATGDAVTADGDRCPVAVLLFAVRDDTGALEAVVCVARDGADLERAEDQLRDREQWFRTLMLHTSDAVTVLDADLVITYASPSCLDVMLVAPETLTGSRFLDHVEASDRELVDTAILEARTSRGPTTIRYGVQRSDGSARVFESRIEDLLEDPVIGGITINTRDVTEVESQAHARDRSEAAFRTVVRSAPAAIYSVGIDGKIQLWNPACEAMFGWSADEVIGEVPPFLTEPQKVEASKRARSLLAGEEINAEATFRRRDGGEVTVGMSVAPIVAGDGSVTSVITVALDLTDRVNATAALEHRAEVDRTIAACSRAMVDATPATFDDCLRETLHALVDQFRASAAALYLRETESAVAQWPADADIAGCLIFDGRPAGPFTVPNENGETIAAGWVMAAESGQLGIVALKWDHPTTTDLADLESLDVIGAAMIAARDRVAAETAVRESDLRFRTLAEHSTDLVMVVGGDFQPTYVSPAASRFLGITDQDRFDPAASLLHPDDSDAVRAQMAEILRESVGTQSDPVVARFLRMDGEYRWVEMVVTNLLEEPLVRGLVINARDITQRRNAEDQLRESEMKFRGLVQNLAEGVTVLAADGSVKYSSPSAARMLGFEVDFGMGQLGLDFIVEEDRDRAADVVARAYTEPGIQGPIVLRVHGSDGTIHVVEAMGHNRLDDPAVEGVVVTTRDITERVDAETLARRSDARLSALVENLSDVVTIVSADGEMLYSSPASKSLFGFEEGDESWTDPISRMHPDDRDLAVDRLGQQVAGASQEPVQFRLRDAAGGWHSVEAIARDMTGDPDVGGIVVTTRDVSARTRAETLVADQAKVLTLIARGAPLSSTLSTLCEVIERNVGDVLCGFLVVDQERQVLQLGAGPRIPKALADACRDIPIGGSEDAFGATAAQGKTAVILDMDGDVRAESLRDVAGRCGISGIWSTPIFDSLSQRVIGTVAMFFESPREPTAGEREVLQMFSQTAAIAIERQTAEDLLAHRANHDSLTGLPNRVLFLEFLSMALARAERDDGKVAVLFLDLDRFKHINDGLGHDAGDEVLRELARRLQAVMRPTDVIARFGGDEFTVLCDGLDGSRIDDHIADIARRLLDVVEQPLSIGEDDRRLSASVGIAVASPGCSAEDLLRDSDAAMYEAKLRGKARWEVFDDDMRSSVRARLDLESRLERALEREEFRLFLQPMIQLATGRCVGAEALLRWQDPEKGLVTPDAFIGLAEETGLIIPIGEWALAEACRTVARWEEVGLLSREFTMSVNLSARQVAQADLVDRVRAVIQQSGPMASRLCLEITESVLMEESSVEAMQALRDLGVRLSIDDFGTGYSSLGYLKRFPVDSVKVDRSFVDGLGTDSEDSAIVAAVVSLGHALGLSVVAEGVETSGQLQELLKLGCDRAQGYWFSGPRDPTEFAGLLNNQPWIDGRSAWAS